jgi:hypothetical protein
VGDYALGLLAHAGAQPRRARCIVRPIDGLRLEVTVLDPVPQRDAATREPVVGCVVVRGDEDPRLDRLAPELGQLELACCAQLHLALERLADRHPPSLGTPAVKRR